MPGKCADCGILCDEKADDGMYYCDPCCAKWTDEQVQGRQVRGADHEHRVGFAQECYSIDYPPRPSLRLRGQKEAAACARILDLFLEDYVESGLWDKMKGESRCRSPVQTMSSFDTEDSYLLLLIVKPGRGHLECPCDLATCEVVYKITEGCQLVEADSCEVVLGEDDLHEGLECLLKHLTTGSYGVLEIAEGAWGQGLPATEQTVEAELVDWAEPCRGPGTSSWRGMRSMMAEVEFAEVFLDAARAAQDRSTEHEIYIQANAVKRHCACSLKRFQRAKAWLDSDKIPGSGVNQMKARVLNGIAAVCLLEKALLKQDES